MKNLKIPLICRYMLMHAYTICAQSCIVSSYIFYF